MNFEGLDLATVPNITLTPFQGNCLAPWMQEDFFTSNRGHLPGRYCTTVPQLPGSPSCCLPCPSSYWTYSDSLLKFARVAGIVNATGLGLVSFLLISYMVLPAHKTRSHYLNVCLVITAILIGVGFLIPFAGDSSPCADAITPNDMRSSQPCAWSGAFALAGTMTVCSWLLIRSLSMFLQICCDMTVGKRFFYISQILGWGIPAILLIPILLVTGVSYRNLGICTVNSKNSMADYWGLTLAALGIAGLLQVLTFGYCVNVYMRTLWYDTPQGTEDTGTGTGTRLPSYANSGSNQGSRMKTARGVYSRVSKVLFMQWRGITIVILLLICSSFSSIVLVYLDNLQSNKSSNHPKAAEWTLCLAQNPLDKNKCLPLTHGWILNQRIIEALIILLSLSGVIAFLILGRPAIYPAWYIFFREKLSRRQEFVSFDARSLQGHMSPQQMPILGDRGYAGTPFDMQKPHDLVHETDMESLSMTTVPESPHHAHRSMYHRDRTPGDHGGMGFPRYFDPMAPLSELPARTSTDRDRVSSPSRVSELPTYDYYPTSNYYRNAAATPDPYTRIDTLSDGERIYRPPALSFSSPMSPVRQPSQRSSP